MVLLVTVGHQMKSSKTPIDEMNCPDFPSSSSLKADLGESVW